MMRVQGSVADVNTVLAFSSLSQRSSKAFYAHCCQYWLLQADQAVVWMLSPVCLKTLRISWNVICKLGCKTQKHCIFMRHDKY